MIRINQHEAATRLKILVNELLKYAVDSVKAFFLEIELNIAAEGPGLC